MPATETGVFLRALDRAFDRASNQIAIATGPFTVDLRLDQWARDLRIEAAFRPAPDAATADFSAAIVGGADDILRQAMPVGIDRSFLLDGDDFYALWYPAPVSTLFAYDYRNRRALMWFAHGTAAPWLLSRPLLPAIHAHARSTPWCPVHAAGVGADGRFILLTGPGHSGKSTAAFACAASGWEYAGDDLVMVDPHAGRLTSLFASGRLRMKGSDPLADLAKHLAVFTSDEEGERRYELRFPKVSTTGGVVAAIVIPRRRGGVPFEFTPAKASEVFASIYGVTAMLNPGHGRELTQKLFAVARMAPAFFVDTGTDPLAIPAALQQFMQVGQGREERSSDA